MAKGLGVILVMLGHLNLPFWLINSIYFFHMPLFVIISGYFHKVRSPREVVNSTVRLYLSYLVYGIVFLIISYILSGKVELKSLGTLVLARPASIWDIPYFGIFWFIIALMIIKVIAQLVKPNNITLVISLVLFFVVWYLQTKGRSIVDLPFAPAQVVLLFPFYIIGLMIKGYLPGIQRWRWLVYIAFLITGILSIVLADGTERKIVNYHQLSLFNPVIALLLAILGSMSLIILSGAVVRFKNRITDIVLSIGEYSFTYFALHIFLFAMIAETLNRLHVFNASMHIIIMFLGTLLISRLAIMVFQRLERGMPIVTKLFLLK